MIEKKNVKYLGIDKNLIELEETILKIGKENPQKLSEIDFSPLINPQGNVPLKAEEIGKILGKGWSSTKVNNTLTQMDFQVKIKDDYYPTEKGIKSGCLHRAILLDYKSTKVAFGLSILWTIDVVDKIKEYLSENTEVTENEEK